MGKTYASEAAMPEFVIESIINTSSSSSCGVLKSVGQGYQGAISFKLNASV